MEKKIISFLQTDFQLPFGDDGQTVRKERGGRREEREKGWEWGWEDRERENERKTRGAGEEERDCWWARRGRGRQLGRRGRETYSSSPSLPPLPPSLPPLRPPPNR